MYTLLKIKFFPDNIKNKIIFIKKLFFRQFFFPLVYNFLFPFYTTQQMKWMQVHHVALQNSELQYYDMIYISIQTYQPNLHLTKIGNQSFTMYFIYIYIHTWCVEEGDGAVRALAMELHGFLPWWWVWWPSSSLSSHAHILILHYSNYTLYYIVYMHSLNTDRKKKKLLCFVTLVGQLLVLRLDPEKAPPVPRLHLLNQFFAAFFCCGSMKQPW